MANRLSNVQSPYLRQHAHQPVDWQPWDAVALRQAREEDKPIILSIGFATCHWCHVMARESFDDPDIAAFMNAHFVCIKVDREERPDLDQFYTATGQIIARNSGWPMNCFLTPAGQPFYAGTYFPPEPSGRQLSWLQALQYAQYNFRQNRKGVEQQAERVLATLQRREAAFSPTLPSLSTQDEEVTKKALDSIHQKIMEQADQEQGGFGKAPKYPDFSLLRYLAHQGHFQKNKHSLQHLRFSLQEIAAGGIYDQLGAGLARYAVDSGWRIPHFEKMLVDNIQWVEILAIAHRLFPENASYLKLLKDNIAFVEQAFGLPTGGFGSALDAETEGIEGKYYTWTYQELAAVAGEKTLDATKFLGVTKEGNWESTNILYRPKGEETPTNWSTLQTRLLDARSKRVPPQLDDKIVLGPNAYLISTWVEAAPLIPEKDLIASATTLWSYLLEIFWEPQQGRLGHSFQGNQLQHHGFLADYAFFIQASIDLFEATSQPEYLEKATELTELTLQLFREKEAPLLNYTSIQQRETPLAQIDIHDLELPSGNSIMHRNLWRLGLHLDRTSYLQLAAKMLATMQDEIVANPLAHGDWASHLLLAQQGYLELGILGPQAKDWLFSIRRDYFLPQAIHLASEDGKPNHPLTNQRPVEQTQIYICQDYACQRPLTDLKAFDSALEATQ